MDITKPGQVIRWALKEGALAIPAQAAHWDFLRGKKDPMIFFSG